MLTKGHNKNCLHFPCHKDMEDCTFCYCPFYPCLRTDRGGYWKKKKNGDKVWACENCTWIHKKDTVQKVHDFLYRNKDQLL